MIIAKQVPPEYQGWPFDHIDIQEAYPGIILHGNRDYNNHTTPVFDSIIDRFDGEKRILRALHLMTGKRYEKRTIRGCCQGDWQEVYYPVADYTRESLDTLETGYFNLGTEWNITTEEDPDGYYMYCYEYGADAIRAEIASAEETTPENVTLLEFDGWSRTPKYKEV